MSIHMANGENNLLIGHFFEKVASGQVTHAFLKMADETYEKSPL
jgi:hypothetical protein